MTASTMSSAGQPGRSRLSILWLSVFTLLAVAALLFAFQRVVHASVSKAHADRIQQGEAAQAVWQCNRLPAHVERRACVAAAAGTERLPDVLVSSSAR